MNGAVLAYVGDSYYEHHIRLYLVGKGTNKVGQLHKMATQFTSAVAQAKIVDYFLSKELLTLEEIGHYKHGRNISHPGRKNVSLEDYHKATGFEALIGFLSLHNQKRADTLVSLAIAYIEESL